MLCQPKSPVLPSAEATWLRARRAAGLPDRPGLPLRSRWRNGSRFSAHEWNAWSPPEPIVWLKKMDEPRACVAYLRIWKSASEAVIATLDGAAKASGGRLRAQRRRPQPSQCPRAVRFSVVRDPLSHFVAGFAELVWRLRGELGAKTVDEALARQFVVALLDGELPPRAWPASPRLPYSLHLAPQAGALRIEKRFPIKGGFLDYVVPLEQIGGGWAEAMARTGVPDLRGARLAQCETHSKDHGPCAAQGDPQGARAALRAVLKGSAPLRRGVCELLRVDYEWLGACNYSMARCVGEN